MSEIGVNQISDISFVIDNDTEIKAAARQKAIAEAKQKAQEMANAANIELGKIIEINESVSGLTPQRIVYQKTIESADATAPIEIGTNEIVVSVSLIYEIK